MEPSTEETTGTASTNSSDSSEKLMKNKNFIQKPGFTVRRSNSSLRTAQPPPSLPLSTVSATAAILPSPIMSSSSSLPSSATSNGNQRRLSIAPSLARNSLISQYSPVIEHATEITVSQPNSTSPDNNSITLPPYRRASISEVSIHGSKSRPGSTSNDNVGVSRKSSIVVIEKSRRSTNEMESVLSDMKALRKASIKGENSTAQADSQPEVCEQIKTSSSPHTFPVEPLAPEKLPSKSTSSKHSKGLSDRIRDKKLPQVPVPFDFTPNEENTSPKKSLKNSEYNSEVSTTPTIVMNASWGPAKMLSPVPGSAGSSAVNFPILPKTSAKSSMKQTQSRINIHDTDLSSATETNINNISELEVVKRNRRFTHPAGSTSIKSSGISSEEAFATAPNSPEVQSSQKYFAEYAADNEQILPPEPPFAESTNPNIANSSNDSFLTARSYNDTLSDDNRTAVLDPSVQSQQPIGLQSPFTGISSIANIKGKGGLNNLMMKAQKKQKRLNVRSVSSPLAATSFQSSNLSVEHRLKPSLIINHQSTQQKSAGKNIVTDRDDDDNERFAHAHEDEVLATGDTRVKSLHPGSGVAPEEELKTFYESNASVSSSSSDGENIGIRRRVGRTGRTASNPEGLSARQKRSSQRLTHLSRDPIVDPIVSASGHHHHHHHHHHHGHYSSKPRSRRHHRHDETKKRERSNRIPFDTPSMQRLLDLSKDTFKLRDLDIPPTERILIEKFVDSLARLSADIATDYKKRPEGIRRLHNALRAIEGWI